MLYGWYTVCGVDLTSSVCVCHQEEEGGKELEVQRAGSSQRPRTPRKLSAELFSSLKSPDLVPDRDRLGTTGQLPDLKDDGSTKPPLGSAPRMQDVRSGLLQYRLAKKDSHKSLKGALVGGAASGSSFSRGQAYLYGG